MQRFRFALTLHGVFVLGLAAACCAASPATAGDPAAENAAREILRESGVHGGLVVHLGCGDGKVTAALRVDEGFLVHGLDGDVKNVQRARDYVHSLGLYGEVSVDTFEGNRLPYVENLVNLVVAEEPGDVATEEIMRVLAPGGVAYLKQGGKWEKKVKPWPDNIDQWTHYLHDASGNAVADDEEVGPPKRVRWVAGPLWSRSHEFNPSMNAAVTAGGRLFYLFDEGQPGLPDLRFPARWSVFARDAFSGVLLWKRPLPNWGYREWNTRGMWSAPLTLNRRLVSDGRRVFVTLGYNAPVTVLDAVTGEEVHTLQGTGGTDEMILSDGVLLACVRERLSVAAPPDEKQQQNRRRRLNPHEWTIGAPGPATVVAFDAKSGEEKWRHGPEDVTVLTLAALDGRVCFHGENTVTALDLQTGGQVWTTPVPGTGGSRHSRGTLVMHDGVVLFTSGQGIKALALEDGKELWTGPKVSGPGVTHPPDLFVADGLVWGGDVAGSHFRDRTAVEREGRDLHTGEVKRTVKVNNLISPLHHFRCYRTKATNDYLLLTKRGVEFLDLQGGDHMRNDWLRAMCHYGFIPANGLLYVPPHHCFCYPGVKMTGFLALAAERECEPDQPAPAAGQRLERGPGCSTSGPRRSHASTAAPDAWPTYRHDAARSGSTKTAVPTDLVPAWEADLGGKITPAVVADGRLLVARSDAQTVHALSADDGRSLWQFTAGGRVDSPPTIHGELVLFGCCDGWVYCLKAEDGELVWRFRAAPEDCRVVAFERLESPWPVPGSVLVVDKTAYVSAGRSSFLDKGVSLYGFDAETGEVVCRTTVEGPWPDVEKETGRPFDMEGTKSDVLVSDGEHIYLYQMMFDKQLNEVEAPRLSTLGDRKVGRHLMATGGFLEDVWYDRTYWTYSERWPGFYFANDAPKAGQILVFSDATTFGLHVFTKRLRLTPAFEPESGYELFADANDNEPVLAPNSIDREKGPGYSRAEPPKWSKQIPVRALAMVLAGDTLFLAGPPDVVPKDDPYAAFDGRLDAKLWAVSAADGEKLSEMSLESVPVFDGLIAAGGRLYLSTADGKVRCMTGKR